MRKFTADFETIVDPNDCRVWAWAVCEIGVPTNIQTGTTIDTFIEWCDNPKRNFKLYFHNLKFDGEYILSYLLTHGYTWIEDKKYRKNKTFTTLITDTGQFYSIEIYFKTTKGHVNKVIIQDSLKILNFSVDKIAKDFDLPLSKLKIDYKAYRSPNHQLTPDEEKYIKADVEIMARALEIMFNNGLTKMTIASDALGDFKDSMGKNFRKIFPVLQPDVDEDIRQSYKGGFTYLSDKWSNRTAYSIVTLDVNSLYPSRLKYCDLPYGVPEPFTGKYEFDYNYPLYVQKLSCTFEIKPDKIPSIQLKHCMSFVPNEYVKSSNGELVTMTLTSVDLDLFFEQYNVSDITYHGGWMFKSHKGFFTGYVDKWTASKIKSKKDNNKSMYAISKLMLNSLYGKFGLSGKGAKKKPLIDSDGVVRYTTLESEDRETVYIPVASFTTAYARRLTIETSQMIRDWTERNRGYDGYIYSDTDSIHCTLDVDDLEKLSKHIQIDDYILGAWKFESFSCKGKFIRQKCYIEEGMDGVLNVTVAGLPKRLAHIINFDNFKVGFSTEDISDEEIGEDGRKLTYRHVKGGVILEDTEFTIK